MRPGQDRPTIRTDLRPVSGGLARESSTQGSTDATAAWAVWLRGIKWDWFVTLAYSAGARGASPEKVKRDALAWLEKISEGAPKAYALVVYEYGPALGGWHAHVVVGGLGAHPSWPDTFRSLWRHHGPPYVLRYDPEKDPAGSERGLMPYLRKQADVEWDIVGRLKKFRPRRRAKAGESY